MGFEIDFLGVGDESKSGDAIALRFGDLHSGHPSSHVVGVVDGGYEETGRQLVDHIRKHYGRDDVDFVLSTHPDADHTNGLLVVLEEMPVGVVLMHQPWAHTEDIARMFESGRVTDASVRAELRKSLDVARDLETVVKRKGIRIVEPFEAAHGWDGAVRILGPSEAYYESLLPGFRGTPEPKDSLMSLLQKGALRAADAVAQLVEERWDIETLTDEGETSFENNSSAITLITHGGKSAFLTGDAGMPALEKAMDYFERVGLSRQQLQLVQAPHHGSRRNVGPTILNRILGTKLPSDGRLRWAVVSCAKQGAPTHPSKKACNAFRRRGAPVWATQGAGVRFAHEAPPRPGWSGIEPLPFYNEVEEIV